jgi:hypothetical protein
VSNASEVADEMEIRNLVARVARLADHGDDLDEYVFRPAKAGWRHNVRDIVID